MGEKQLLELEDIEELSKHKHKSEMHFIRKLNDDSKNLFVRITKEVKEHFKLSKGQEVELTVDTSIKKEEVVIRCRPLKKN